MVTIEIYKKENESFGFRLIGDNGQKFGHDYNSADNARQSIGSLVRQLATGDFIVVKEID